MKQLKLITSLFLIIAAFAISKVYSQDALSLYPTVAFAVGDSCAGPGLEQHDDGSFDNGGGWNTTITDGRWVQKFRPASYPWKYNKFCIGFTRTAAGADQFTYQVVIYDSTAAGPGTLLYTSAVQNVTGIGTYPAFTWFSTDISASSVITSGAVYIGIKADWSLATNANKFVMFDQAGPLWNGYGWANAGPWTIMTTYFAAWKAFAMRAQGGTPVSPSCNCLPGWSYKAPLVIQNPNATAFTSFEVGDTINTAALVTAGKMKADGSDIRFADSLCNNIPYWIQSGMNTATTIIWFKVPNLPASGSRTVWMYYGNPAATAASNGMNTFKFFEGFDGNTLQQFTAQSCGTGTAVVSGGTCAFSWSSVGQWVADTVLPQSTIYVEEMNVTAATGNWPGIMSFNQGGATGGYAMLMGSSQVRISYAVAGNYCSGHNWANTPVNYSTVVGLWSICWQATGTQWGYFPGLGLQTATNTSQTRNADQRLTIGGCSSGAGSVTVDWVRARQFAPIQPFAGTPGTEVATPPAPSGLTAAPVGNNINLTWVDNSTTEDKFIIQRSTDNGTTWNNRDSVNANVVAYSDPIPGNGTFCYRVAAKNCMGLSAYTTQQCVTITGITKINEVPKVFKLYQNYPNPFNPSTNVKFDIPTNSFVKLIIYDLTGREVELLVNKEMNAGSYNVDWNASKYASGVYFYKLEAGTYEKQMKMILVK